MSKVSPLQHNFNGGELSPLMFGRPDIDKYKTGLAQCENFIPLVQGGLAKRPGTQFVSAAKNADKKARLVEFIFSQDQAYVLEFGDQYIRFYTQHGQVGSGAFAPVFAPAFNTFSTYEIASPYLEADLFQLKFAQSADILYIVHPDYAPRELRRLGNTNWTLTQTVFKDGPFLNTNTTDTSVAVTGTGAARTLTFSAVTGINDDAGFSDPEDIGRMVRVNIPGAASDNTGWQWLKIASVTSTTIVVCTADNDTMTNGSGIVDWRVGVWSEGTGYPSSIAFSGDRLFYGGATDTPQRLDGSRVGDYPNFSPSDKDGTVVDDHGIGLTLNADQVNDIYWLLDDEKGLVAGTQGGEWVIRPSANGEALTPSNIDAKRSTTHGSTNIQARRTGKAIMFVTPSGRKLREMGYVFEDDGFRSPDATLISEHISGDGFVEFKFQRENQSILWCVRNDGTLAGLTYERDNSVVGWHRHLAGGTDAKVESVAVIPEPNGNGEELWVLVSRTVNGATARHIEYMKPVRTRSEAQSSAFFVDSGLTYMNGGPVTTVGGLQHLEGETVKIQTDGANHPDKVVVGGFITLDRPANTIVAGLGFTSKMKTLRPEAGARDGTAQGKTARMHSITVRLWESLGGSVGVNEGNTFPMITRSGGDAMDTAVPLFTGDKIIEWESPYDSNVQIYLEHDDPLPFMLLAIMPQLVTQDSR